MDVKQMKWPKKSKNRAGMTKMFMIQSHNAVQKASVQGSNSATAVPTLLPVSLKPRRPTVNCKTLSRPATLAHCSTLDISSSTDRITRALTDNNLINRKMMLTQSYNKAITEKYATMNDTRDGAHLRSVEEEQPWMDGFWDEASTDFDSSVTDDEFNSIEHNTSWLDYGNAFRHHEDISTGKSDSISATCLATVSTREKFWPYSSLE